jgi:hypothetical protein
MKETAITIDVYCNWVVTKYAYRVYVDDDLLTERTYAWNNPTQFIRERILVNLEPGEHTIRVEPVNPLFKWFRYENVHINNQPTPIVNNRFLIV